MLIDAWTNLFAMILREGEGNSGGAADDKPADPPKSEGSDDAAKKLFPNEGGDKKPDDKPADPLAGDDKKPEDKPAEWKEYVPDPKKTDEENAAAKAEHDKTKPADKKTPEELAAVIPDDGKYQLTMPEGIELDQTRLDKIGPLMAKHKLTTGAVQEIINAEIEIQREREIARVNEWSETVAGWLDTAKKDKDIGGDKWDATSLAAKKAIDKLGTPALREYMDATGGGNHPELIRFAAKVGAMLRDDVPPTDGSGGSGKPADVSHILFPNDVPKG